MPWSPIPARTAWEACRRVFLEMSNVKVIDEMVAIITSQRAYEATSKAIQTADEMLSMANNMRR
jgi:flagellar basal-body rod protein FlgG